MIENFELFIPGGVAVFQVKGIVQELVASNDSLKTGGLNFFKNINHTDNQ